MRAWRDLKGTFNCPSKLSRAVKRPPSELRQNPSEHDNNRRLVLTLGKKCYNVVM